MRKRERENARCTFPGSISLSAYENVKPVETVIPKYL